MLSRAAMLWCAACAGVSAAMSQPVRADSPGISLEAGTERDPHDFSRATLNFDTISFTDTYDNGWGWTALVQNYRAANHGPITWLGEGLIGYRHKLTSSLSLYAGAGGGQRQSPTRDFPFFGARAGADELVADGLVWNAVNLRYRTGFDPHFPYHSSSVGSGLSWHVSERNEFFGRVFAVFNTNYSFAGTGLAIGLRALV